MNIDSHECMELDLLIHTLKFSEASGRSLSQEGFTWDLLHTDMLYRPYNEVLLQLFYYNITRLIFQPLMGRMILLSLSQSYTTPPTMKINKECAA